MDLKQIKQIVDLMTRSDLTDFEIEEEGLKIKIKRGSNEGASGAGSAHPFVLMPSKSESAPAAAPAATSVASAPAAAAANDDTGFVFVKSPMVGTFYRSPSPENPSFVDAGSKVDEKLGNVVIRLGFLSDFPLQGLVQFFAAELLEG